MYIDTNTINQVDKIREIFLRGIAATFPLSTKIRIERWMIVQRLGFNPHVALSIYDDLIKIGVIRREYEQSRCKCSTLEVYKLTDLGHEILKQIL